MTRLRTSKELCPVRLSVPKWQVSKYVREGESVLARNVHISKTGFSVFCFIFSEGRFEDPKLLLLLSSCWKQCYLFWAFLTSKFTTRQQRKVVRHNTKKFHNLLFFPQQQQQQQWLRREEIDSTMTTPKRAKFENAIPGCLVIRESSTDSEAGPETNVTHITSATTSSTPPSTSPSQGSLPSIRPYFSSVAFSIPLSLTQSILLSPSLPPPSSRVSAYSHYIENIIEIVLS